MTEINMKQIAEMVGVSTSTVSRVFHSPEKVSLSTRQRILQKFEEYGYVYDAVAGDFSRKRSTVIGVLTPSTSKFGISIQAIQDKSQEKEFSLIIGNTKYDKNIEYKLIQQFLTRRVAGMILTGFNFGQEKIIKNLIKSGHPCVIIWEKLDDELISYVGIDNFKAAYMMTEYLIRLKHKRIGLLIGPYSKMRRTQRRLHGYMAALDKYGIPFDESLVVERDLSLIEGKQGMMKLLNSSDRPTAVFAASDALAIGALAGAKEIGLHVPDQVSLAGFGDIEWAAFCDPPLTTVRVPAYEIGKMAVKVLLEMIEKGKTEVNQYCLNTDLIVRNSCVELRKEKRE